MILFQNQRVFQTSPRSTRENLSRYRWHTGALPRPVSPGEQPAVLFRDVGSMAMARFLGNGLRRLAGPETPITYLRTAAYREPYVDYEKIGRIVLLRPMEVVPWHSGVPHIFIACASRMPNDESIGFVPGSFTLETAEQLLSGAHCVAEMREALGGAEFDALRRDGLERLNCLHQELSAVEKLAVPIRVSFRTGSFDTKRRILDRLADFGLDEGDLCAAWHHLPRARRIILKEALPSITDGARGKGMMR